MRQLRAVGARTHVARPFAASTRVARSGALAIGALAWAVAACGTGQGTAHDDAAPSDVEAAVDAAGLDARDGGDAGGFDAPVVADGADAADADLHPTAPPCHAGDRSEWTGLIPSTTLAVSVCSTCAGSYVIASNGGASSGNVTVDNGSHTAMVTVAAGAMASTTPLADNPADGTVTVCGTSGAHGCLPVAPQNQQYCDPFRAMLHLVPERIDQGVDYAGSGPIYAIGPGQIDVYRNRSDTGWPGGTFMSYRVTAGPATGKTIFLAENIDLNPSLHAGSVVYSGTVLGTQVDASPESEIGWGVPGAGYTAEHSCYSEGCTTALGSNFNQLLVCVHTPSGVTNAGGCCSFPPGYATDWCTQLSHWQ